jgi:hypothetical protein
MDRTAASPHEDIALSRSSGLPPRLGKSTNRVSANVPDEVADAWTRLARSVDMSESKLLALTMMERLWGREAVLIMVQEQAHLALGIGPKSDQKATT